MNKPTLFFSHSSKDKELIMPIKEKLDKSTGGVLEIFMSSDGQSIPFGTNWIHKIEAGLQSAKIMFVFVTENSVSSGWIYFEAGYAYSKGIQVIPVGIGIDIGGLKAPLNLLQGFNITAADSLNNFITIINKTFSYKFENSFIEDDFLRLDGLISRTAENIIDFEDIIKYGECEIYSRYHTEDGNIEQFDTDEYFRNIVTYLEKNKIPYSIKEKYHRDKDTCIVVSGIKITHSPTFIENAEKILSYDEVGKVKFRISSYNFKKSFELLKVLIGLSNRPNCFIKFYLNDGYSYVTTEEDSASIISENFDCFGFVKDHLAGYSCNNLNVEFYIFKDLKNLKETEKEYVLSVVSNCNEFSGENLIALIYKLFEIKIIHRT